MGKGMRAGKKPKTRQGGGGDMQKQLRQLRDSQPKQRQKRRSLQEKLRRQPQRQQLQ